jgi:predicted dienelactone hydrolase
VLYPALPRSAGPTNRDRMTNDDEAALDWSGAPYPLVIFVHGSLSDRRTSRSLQRNVVRAGYIVVAADFPLTSINSSEGISDAHAEDEIGDVSFLAGQLTLMNATRDQLLDGAIDPDRYAVVGHSSGATVALVAQLAPLLHDDRMLGVIAMAPATCFLADELFQTRALPLLVLAGTNDHIVPYADNTARPYALVGAPKLLASFAGGKHAGFTDLDIEEDLLGVPVSTERSALGKAFAAYGVERTCAPIRDAERSGDRSMRFEEQHRRTAQWTVAFLDRILYGASSALTSLEEAGDSAVAVQHDGI